MPDMHALLDECQTQCQALVEEIKALKQSRSLHEQATNALETTSKALQETAARIQPFTDVRFKRFVVGVIIGAVLNVALAAAVLVVLILKG
jgi:hypothetical protein